MVLVLYLIQPESEQILSCLVTERSHASCTHIIQHSENFTLICQKYLRCMHQ